MFLPGSLNAEEVWENISDVVSKVYEQEGFSSGILQEYKIGETYQLLFHFSTRNVAEPDLNPATNVA